MSAILDYKIEIFIPPEFLDDLREALAKADIGHIGNYDHCLSVMEVNGYWRPLAGANPFDGSVGQVSSEMECKVEVSTTRELVAAALDAIRSVHPYEEPVINIIPLANAQFMRKR